MTFRSSLLAAVLGSVALTAGVPARALTPYRVADVNPTFQSAGSHPDHFARVGARALFVARTPGLGLWASDGTAGGTVRLARNQVSIDFLAATGDLLFFISCDAQRCRLFATDGTVAGTRAVASPLSSSAASVVAGPRRIYFVRETAALGHELWTSDGTPAGTRLVKDLVPGPSSSVPENLVWFRDRLWFFALNGLWTSDGKASGTRRIAEVGRAVQVGTAGSRLLFSTFAMGGTGVRLWSSDGTAAGTRVLPGVSPRTGTGQPFFASTGTDAYFVADRQSPTGFLSDLWASDGTPGKTRKLATFDGDGLSSFFLVAGSRVAFAAFDEAHGYELWTSDGRAAGTRSFDLCPGDCDGLRSLSETSAVSDGRRIWFAGTQGFAGDQLWVSDLTRAGTHIVEDFTPDTSANPRFFQAGGGKVFFLAGQFSDTQLWTSDGTSAGTRSLTPRSDDDSEPDIGPGTVVNGRLFFRFGDDAHGAEPWVTNGAPAGTALVADLEPSQDGGSFPFGLSAAAGRCFFFANSASSGRESELWSSDGSEAGTVRARRFAEFEFLSGTFVADLGTRAALIDYFQRIWISDGTANGTFRATGDDLRVQGSARALGGRLLFTAYDEANGGELWATDGTSSGTLRLSDFANPEPFPDGGDSERRPFRVLGDRIVFFAADPLGRLEPWVSDGTIGGTRRLAEVYPALVASFFELSSEIVQAGGKSFYVSGEGSEAGTEPALWVTDLTVAGTRKIGPLIDSNGAPASETGLYALGSRVILFYRGATFELGFETSDGTNLAPGAIGTGLRFDPRGSPVTPSVWNGRLVFRADDDRLYATDGTGVGTVRLVRADGQEIQRPSAFAVLGDRLAFADSDGIWESDGTPAGTVRRLASRTSAPFRDFVRVGDRIFFPWYDAATGTELWALRP
ncbi:MAG TPA: hypothetical protein VN851_18985 [Thermoanaerobaculia bacterium]|nr:hypothetical protein [Thermoanaerobaculia bacterium]